MPVKSGNKKVRVKRGEGNEQQIPQNLFPEIFILSELRTDTSLPLLKFVNVKEIQRTNHTFFNLQVKLPNINRMVDLFLFINGLKRDIFYQVAGGEYEFKNIRLGSGKNLVELFYRIGGKKSSSFYSVIHKEQGN